MANTKQIQETELEVEVLYQKLGDRWFAFSIVNDEVFMSPVSDDQIAVAKRGTPTTTDYTPNADFEENEAV
jgi:hypothetical protein